MLRVFHIFFVIQNILSEKSSYARIRQVESTRGEEEKSKARKKVVHGQNGKKNLANVLHFLRVVKFPRAQTLTLSLNIFPLE
jgi:hypothetical protein